MRLASLSNLVGVDTETTGLNQWKGDRPFCISMHDDEGHDWFLRWEVNPFTREITPPSKQKVKALNRFFADPRRRFVFHHGKFDVAMLVTIGVTVLPGTWDDTLVASKVLRTGEYSYRLKQLATRYVNIPTSDEKDLKESVRLARRKGKPYGWMIGNEVEQDYWLGDPVLCKKYALLDAKRTVLLWLLFDSIMDDEGVRETYDREMALQPLVLRMEARGVNVNPELIIATAKKVKLQRAQLRTVIAHDIGPTFNPNSSPQKVKLFYGAEEEGGLGFEPTIFTKQSKAPSVAAAALEEIGHPFAELILKDQAFKKELEFFETWSMLLVDSCRLHPFFEPNEAKTGRFSCRGPNLQQVPRNDPEKTAQARAPFIPRPGYMWIVVDYSQMELRMLAALAQEWRMLDAFSKGRDIHEETAIAIWGEEVRGDIVKRYLAKNINFAICYGAQAAKIGAMMGKDRREGERILDLFYTAFPSVADFMMATQREVRRRGYITNDFGRRVHVKPEMAYVGTNMKIQSLGADIIKTAMPRVDDIWRRNDVDAELILQIHDELVSEVEVQAFRPWMIKEKSRVMIDHRANIDNLELPVDVSIVAAGGNWAEKKAWEEAA